MTARRRTTQVAPVKRNQSMVVLADDAPIRETGRRVLMAWIDEPPTKEERNEDALRLLTAQGADELELALRRAGALT